MLIAVVVATMLKGLGRAMLWKPEYSTVDTPKGAVRKAGGAAVPVGVLSCAASREVGNTEGMVWRDIII